MSAVVEQPSNSGAMASSAATASGVKISKFATKSGFLIPKNKLSGSLIPIFRGGKKGGGDASNEADVKPVQRKTRWGPDLTQDTAVKKGRALAYQTRVDQITQELSLGKLEIANNQDLSSTSQIQDISSSDHQLKSQELEVLELERREAIGEILKLNPSYKAPADYKPLHKEAKVPIPVTEFPAYSFVNSIFGPANDTHKRLEKETGAKIQVYGTKADTGLEVQVTTADGIDIHGGYTELHVHVSADTYEKVDVAVALIELLFKPISGTSGSISMSSAAISGDNVNGTALSEATSGTDMPPVVVSSGVAQRIVKSVPATLQNHFRHDGGPWFSIGTTQIPVIPSSGFAAPENLPVPLTSTPLQMPATLFNPSTLPSTYGPQPGVSTGFSPVPQSLPPVPSGPQLPQVLQHQFMPQPPTLGHTGAPRNMFLPVSQPIPIQSNFTLLGLSSNQAAVAGPAPVVRPVMPSLPQSYLAATFSDQQPNPAGWSKASSDNIISMGAGNTMPEATALTASWGHRPVAPHAAVVAPPPNVSPAIAAPRKFQVPSSSIAPVPPVTPQVLHNSSPNAVAGSTPLPLTVTSTSTLLTVQSGRPVSDSGGAVSFSPIRPPFLANPRPSQPSSSDFTFQPHRPQNPEFEMGHRPETRPPLHPNRSVLPLQGPHAPVVQPAVYDLRPPIAHGFSRPNVGSQIMQPNFGSSLTAHPGPPRHGTIPNSSAVPLMQPRNFNLSPRIVSAAGIPPPRAAMQNQQNFPVAVTRPQRPVPPNQPFNGNFSVGRPSPNQWWGVLGWPPQ